MKKNWVNRGHSMKSTQFRMAALAAVFLSAATASASQRVLSADEMYLTFGPAQVELVSETVMSDAEVAALGLSSDAVRAEGDAGGVNLGTVLEDLNGVDVLLDKVVNLGKKVWSIVEANKPVVNVQTDVANALPEGVRAWQSLTGWRAPVAREYRVSYQNLLGVKVVDFSYRVLFTPGGSVNGKGRYLTQVTVLPANIQVLWGYDFNMSAAVPSVTNAGTKTDPVGAAQLQLTWKINTVMKHEQSTQSFYVQGDGMFLDLNAK